VAEDLIQAFITHAQRSPLRMAVHEIGVRSWSRGEILRAAKATARNLQQHAPRDGVVMLHGPGGGRYWAGLLAVLGTGRCLLPVSEHLPIQERRELARAQGVDAILETDPDAAPIRGCEVGYHAPVEGGLDDVSCALDRGGASSLLLRSSGTTGRPAVSLRSGRALDRVTRTLLEVLALGDRDRVFAALPMQHAYGIEHAVMAPMCAGAELAWQPGFELSRGSQELRDRATVLAAVPVTLEAAIRIGSPDAPLRLAYTAGSTLPGSIRERFISAWQVPVGDLYGASELGTITWGVDGESRAVPGVSLRVRQDDGAIAECGTGEIVARSDAMFDGYLHARNGEIDHGDCIEGFFRTGDLGEIDANGRVRVTGRLKSQFDVAGLKVNPGEVEEVLAAHPGVAEIAIVPVRLSETVTRVRAVVVPTSGDHESIRSELSRHATERLAAHLRPRVIDFRESLPRTPSGKIIRHALEEDAEEQPAGHSGRSTSV